MEELCTACLCTGRNLRFIGETGFYDLYSQILNEIPVYDTSRVCVRVCWECRAALHKLHQFKTTVKTSYELLMGLHEKSVQSISRASRLAVQHQPAVSCPLGAVHVKDELEVKVEPDAEEHCEETFVNDYNAEQKLPHKPRSRAKPKQKRINQKKELKKKTHTKKRRKKSISTEESESFDHLEVSDADSICNDTMSNVIDEVLDEGVTKEGILEDSVIKEDDLDEGVLEKKGREELRCPDCGVQFEAKSDLIAHVETDHKEVESKPNGVAAPATRARTKDVIHTVGDKPQCAECGKVFSSRKTYRYHLNVLHKGQNKHQCPRCGKVYQWKSNLGRHIRSHKARDAGELYCELCDKRFASVATYRQHLRVSRKHVTENEFSFVCTACGKKFVNKTRLQDHVDWEHLNKIKFQCQLCHKPFKCHTSLYVHMQNVHRNKEKKDNLCHVCGKSYQNAAKLKYHIVAMHTSETPYQCGDCHAAFGWYSSLYRHVREVHQKMKLQSSKAKKSKRKPPDMVPLLGGAASASHRVGPP